MAYSSSFHEELDNSPVRPTDNYQTVPTQARIPFRREASSATLGTEHRQVSPADHDNVASTGYRGENKNDFEQVGASVLDRSMRLQVPRAYSPVSTDSGAARESYDQTERFGNGVNVDPRGSDSSWMMQQYLRQPDNEHQQAEARLIGQDNDYLPEVCPARDHVLKSGWTWFNALIVTFAVFSWAFSGIFLGLAIAKPRWGFRIGTAGHVSYDTATLLSALLSKLVELTFATTFVITLGQILSRKAFADSQKTLKNQGISLAELNMKLWILQPGTLITHWAGVKHVITTVLGITALAAAVSAAFYTTAAEALVSPKLKFGHNETRQMHGQFRTNFGNVEYMGDTCATAISANDDVEGGSTCMQIDFAGNGFRNLQSWSSVWQMRQNSSADLNAPRPPPTAILYDNTTVHGLWISPSGENVTADSEKYGRFVQNTTMVMPHANVFHAARDPSNKLLQPDDLQGAGQYYIQAAVPVPGINALCVGVSTAEIEPLIGNGTSFSMPKSWPNVSTPIDALFSWSRTPDYANTFPYPWFGKLPIEYNTVGNVTNTYGIPWVYFIAKPPSRIVTQDYIVCGVRSFQYSDCSTSLSAASSGSDLSVHCGQDSGNWKSFEEASGPKNPPVMVTNGADMMYVLQDWVRAVSLTSGISDADTSLARQVTQMIPTYSNTTSTKLDPAAPSIGEAVCVLAGYPLLRASDASPFVNYWDHKQQILDSPILSNFSAFVSYKDYQSGGDAEWKSVFYVILAVVFVLNSFCLVILLYYFGLRGEVTDFTDPQNLFTLAVNSPPSRMVAGACGSGPSAEMLATKWWVDAKMPDGTVVTPHPQSRAAIPSGVNAHPHFYVRYSEEEPLLVSGIATSSLSYRDRLANLFSGSTSNKGRMKLRKKRVNDQNEFDVGDGGDGGRYIKLNER